jgi:hypothetical protein
MNPHMSVDCGTFDFFLAFALQKNMGSPDDTVAIVFGWLGTAGATILFLSPIPSKSFPKFMNCMNQPLIIMHCYFLLLVFVCSVCRKIINRKSILEFSATPYIISLIQCALWVAYAIVTPDRLQPLITNLIGVAMQTTYVILFLTYSTGTERVVIVRHLIAALLFYFAVILLGVLVAPELHFIKVGFLLQQKKQNNIFGLVGWLLCLFVRFVCFVLFCSLKYIPRLKYLFKFNSNSLKNVHFFSTH